MTAEEKRLEEDRTRQAYWREVATDLSRRLTSIFLRNDAGSRPVHGQNSRFHDPYWHDLILFHEYFHGDNGAGLGANHQTGWTGLVANLISNCYS